MKVLAILIFSAALIWFFIRRSRNKEGKYHRTTERYNKGIKKETSSKITKGKKENKDSVIQSLVRKFKPKTKLPFQQESINWAKGFFNIEEKVFIELLGESQKQYKSFRIRKRSGGVRSISAPQQPLIGLQRSIHKRILTTRNAHPAASGFLPGKSTVDNVAPHLGREYVLKLDIKDFFGSIKQWRVRELFKNIGYPDDIAKLLAHLCCLNNYLPQGAPTSPAISNLIAYEMDCELTALAQKHQLVYTRYADDLSFSGAQFSKNELVKQINEIVEKTGLKIKISKTRFLTPKKRKIITGISISSGEKMTIPKATKREIRKNVYFVLSKGLKNHQKNIHSTDPVYLKRLIGRLSYWLSIEPENQYVLKSLAALKRVQRKN